MKEGIILTVFYIIISVLIFGALIFFHEGGHYLTARLFGVTVREFAVGMGPKILKWVSKKSGITYSLRLLPIGGFVSMEGEDEESSDPNAFNKKSVWKRMIITAAGAFTNIVIGILVMSVYVSTSPKLASTTVAVFNDENSPIRAAGILEGDTITRVDGKRVHIYSQMYYEIMRNGNEPIDITVERNGLEVTFENVEFPTVSDSGTTFGTIDFKVYATEKTFFSVLKEAYYQSFTTIKMIWESLFDLIGGRYGLSAVSGPVGVTEALVDAAKTGIRNFSYLAAVISMNLGVMNLLPIPALDGGRLLFQIIELVRRKPINRNVEGYIHFAGLAVLMVLMVLIVFKDVVNLF